MLYVFTAIKLFNFNKIMIFLAGYGAYFVLKTNVNGSVCLLELLCIHVCLNMTVSQSYAKYTKIHQVSSKTIIAYRVESVCYKSCGFCLD